MEFASHGPQEKSSAISIPSLSCRFPNARAVSAAWILRKTPLATVYSGQSLFANNGMRSIIPGVNFPTLHPCWLSTPAERGAVFLPVFVRMSVAIQSVLRERLPAEYFEDAGKYRDLRTAGPMLVYQASPPFRGTKRAELTYDVLNPALIAMLFRRAKPHLAGLLAQAEGRLRAEGLAELADQYAPKRAAAILNCVQRLSKSRRYLYMLIRGETVLVDALVQLSGLGDLPPKLRAKRWAGLGKKWNFQLRRLYPGRDFTHLAAALLAAAEDALQSDTVSLHNSGPGSAGLSARVLQASECECPEVG
jgi:hypothetical protein